MSKETLDSDVTIVYISADGVLYLQDSDSSADIIDKNTTTTETTAVKFIPAINPVHFTPRDKSILFFTGDGSMSFPADDSKMNGFRAYIQLIGAE